MSEVYTVTAVLRDERTIALDEAVPLSETRVKVTIEPFVRTPKRSYAEVMQSIRERQSVRGHCPPKRIDVDRDIETERASWIDE